MVAEERELMAALQETNMQVANIQIFRFLNVPCKHIKCSEFFEIRRKPRVFVKIFLKLSDD